jgi:hypothetical protein
MRERIHDSEFAADSPLEGDLYVDGRVLGEAPRYHRS